MCWLCRRVLIYSSSMLFFSCLFRVSDSCAVLFSCAPAVSSYLRRRRKRKSLIRYRLRFWSLVRLNTTFERSGHPPQANAVPSTIHGKKGTAFVKYTFVLFSAVTPQSDGQLLLVSRSPACLEGTGVLSQSPFNLLLVFFLVVRRLPLQLVVPEVLFLYWQRVRIPCDTIDTRGLLDFETFYPTDPRITDRPTHE